MIRTEFGGRVKKVVVPPEPGKAVVHGAVLYALDQSRLEIRSRRTYGCEIQDTFDPRKDPESRKFYDAYFKGDRCDRVFDVFIKEGDLVTPDQTIVRRYFPSDGKATSVTLVLYETERRQVRHTFEDHVRKAGQLILSMPDISGGREREIVVTMYFGRAVIRVEAIDKASGKGIDTRLDFLSGT